MVKRKVVAPSPPAPRGRRAVQAEQTRAEIVSAARRQFAATGYAGTSVKDIAAAAGVSVQTVYDSVGSKADLVRRLNDLIDDEAGFGDILRTCFDGARAEPDLVPGVEEGGRRHRAGARIVAERLAALDALDADLSLDEVAATIATLADYRVALLMLD